MSLMNGPQCHVWFIISIVAASQFAVFQQKFLPTHYFLQALPRSLLVAWVKFKSESIWVTNEVQVKLKHFYICYISSFSSVE